MLAAMRLLPVATLLLLCCAQPARTQQSTAPTPAHTQPEPAPMTWFVRLLPPRTTFLKDMTKEEHRLMEEHFVYWKEQYAKGTCLFGGPVLDPKGVFGVLVIVADSEEKARTIASADPTVKAGVNHIEVAPMRVAFPPRTTASQ